MRTGFETSRQTPWQISSPIGGATSAYHEFLSASDCILSEFFESHEDTALNFQDQIDLTWIHRFRGMSPNFETQCGYQIFQDNACIAAVLRPEEVIWKPGTTRGGRRHSFTPFCPTPSKLSIW